MLGLPSAEDTGGCGKSFPQLAQIGIRVVFDPEPFIENQRGTNWWRIWRPVGHMRVVRITVLRESQPRGSQRPAELHRDADTAAEEGFAVVAERGSHIRGMGGAIDLIERGTGPIPAVAVDGGAPLRGLALCMEVGVPTEPAVGDDLRLQQEGSLVRPVRAVQPVHASR